MPLLWLIFFTGLILVLQGWIFKKFSGRNVYYTRFFEKNSVFEGEEVRLIEHISNKKILFLPWIRVESKIDSSLKFKKQFNLDIKHQQFHKSLFLLMPFSSIKRLHTIKCLKRGCYTLTSASLTFGDLFGMSENTKISSFNTELLVYPKLLSLNEFTIPNHSFMGDATVKRWIVDDPFMSAGVRDYHAGDPLNRVNWKMSAKTQSLKVCKYDYTANPKLLICLNIESEERMWDSVLDVDLIESGIKLAATIAHHAIDQGISVSFRSNGFVAENENSPVFVPEGSGIVHFELILQTLARIIIKRSVTLYTLLEDDIQNRITNTDIMLLTTYSNNQIEGQLDLLRQLGNAVQIFDLNTIKEKGDIHD